ncbi:tail fiber domain-containing protein [Sulfurovum sp. CS9]|uniref:tail fiber domain-containing protein n=1 Tax=Sulfurovum sp. CS9 TaxID=3391146 RepID=UPI0039E750DB
MKKVKIAAVAVGLLMSTSHVSAVDLFASSAAPSVQFTDTDTNRVLGLLRMDDTTVDYDFLGFWANGYQKWMISMNLSSNTENSIQVASNGDMGLVDSTIIIDKSTQSVGIAKFPQLAYFDVYGDIAAGGTYNTPAGDGLTSLLTLHVRNVATGVGSDAGFALVNERTSKQWNFRTNDEGNSFNATRQGTGGSEFTITNATTNVSGTELYLGNGAKNIGGVWINASSRALKENIKPLSTKEALTAFSKLQPVTYNYKTDKSEKVVGFIAEDVPELVSINSRDGLSSMDMVAVLTKVVAETRAELKAKDERIAAMEEIQKTQNEKIAKLETMQKRVAQLESILTNLALDTSNIKKEKVSLKLK